MDSGADDYYRELIYFGRCDGGKDIERWKAPARRMEPWMQSCLTAHKAKLAMSVHQLALLKNGKFRTGRQVLGDMVQENIERLTVWISERKSLIYAIETGGTV